MRHEFRLADIGEGLEEAEIVQWFVAVGDRIERDEPLIEVMTDKSNAELPAPESGTVVEMGGAVGDLLEVGELIAVIETDVDALPGPARPAVPPPGPLVDTDAPSEAAGPIAQAGELDDPDGPEAAEDPQHVTDDSPPSRPKASPSTRRIAAERGLDLATVRGTGPGGRILLTDLDRAPESAYAPATDLPEAAGTPPAEATDPAQPTTTADPTEPARPTEQAQPTGVPRADPTEPAQPTGVDGADRAPEPDRVALEEHQPVERPDPVAEPPADTSIALRGVRRVVARNMAQSWSTIPHIHAFDEIDAQPLLEIRERLRTTGKATYDHVTPLTFFVAAVARALRLHPEANASIDMDEMTITRHGGVHVGVAVASDHGLVVPVLRNADRLEFAALAEQLSRLVQGAREGLLAAEHFRGGTVTITNFGSLGGVQATPIIRAPEATIFGFGAVARRPFVVGDAVVPRPTLPTVVGADHRLIDGDVATAVLHAVGAALLDPLQLVL